MKRASSFIFNVRRLAIFIVGFSMPFNQVTINIGRSMTVSVLCILFYFILMWKALPVLFKIKTIYGFSVILPLYFFFILTFSNIINSNNSYGIPIFNNSLFWCLILYYIFLVHQCVDSYSLKIALAGFAIGGVAVSICFLTGYQVTINDVGRLTVFNENTNALGIFQGISATIIFHEFIVKDFFGLKFLRWGWILCYPGMIALIVASGSRTAFLVFMLAAAGSVLFYPTSKRYIKIGVLLLGCLLLIVGISKMLESDTVIVDRLMVALETGDTNGRKDLASSLIPAIFENPIFGCGNTGYIDISKNYIGEWHVGEDGVVVPRSPHNVIIETLVLTGIVGFILMFSFWKWSFIFSWRKFKQERDPLYMLLTIPVIACLLSGQLLLTKWAYLLYAYFISPKAWNKIPSNIKV